MAVYLDKPSLTPVTTYLTLIGSATGTVGLAMAPVSFQPGQTCQVVSVPVTGNAEPSATPTTSYKVALSNPGNAVLSASDFGTITVAANAVTTGTTAPPYGVQGDACAEHYELSHPGKLTVVGTGRVEAGGTVNVTGKGYRQARTSPSPWAPLRPAASSPARQAPCRSRSRSPRLSGTAR